MRPSEQSRQAVGADGATAVGVLVGESQTLGPATPMPHHPGERALSKNGAQQPRQRVSEGQGVGAVIWADVAAEHAGISVMVEH